jgi:hypothetical protein
MDSKLILEAARGTLDGTLSFPEVVVKLLAAGVEFGGDTTKRWRWVWWSTG